MVEPSYGEAGGIGLFIFIESLLRFSGRHGILFSSRTQSQVLASGYLVWH